MRTATLALFLTLGISLHAQGPVPRPSKEFTFVTPQGKQILLSSLKGKVVVVQFLSTTCPHCQNFSRVLTQLNTEYGPRGFQALGAGFDEGLTKEQVAAYIQQYAGFPVGISTRSTVLSYLGISELERVGVPQIAVIDRKGVIREQTTSQGGGPLGDPAHLKPLIESLLSEGPGAKASVKSGGSSTKPAAKKTADKKTSE